MLGSRPLGAGVLLVVAGGLTSSCVAVLGLDEKYEDAVTAYCRCDGPRSMTKDRGCVAYFTSRLDSASELARAEWMKTFDAVCRKSCDDWAVCASLSATCTIEGECLDKAGCNDCCTKGPDGCQAG